nr:hypothetical protein [Alphaproteobacteria bacterium]
EATNFTVTGNTGTRGAVGNTSPSSVFNVDVTNNILFQNNTGGAIYKENDLMSLTAVNDISFIGNTGSKGATAINNNGNYSKTALNADTVHFTDNVASASYAGAIFNSGDYVKIFGNEIYFTGNQAGGTGAETVKFGGGAIQNRANVAATNSTSIIEIGNANSEITFSNNTSAANGGAIHARAESNGAIGQITLNGSSTFTSNVAALNGGAVSNSPVNGSSTLTLNGAATFTGNQAGGLGGAVYNTGVTTINGEGLFSGNKSNYIDSEHFVLNDIYNTNVVNLNATSGKSIVFASGIDGVGGTLNINVADGYTGTVVFDAGVSGNNVNVANGILTNNAVLNGALTVNGGSVVSTGVDSEIVGSVSILYGASVSAAADKIATDVGSTISNAGTLTLTGGSLAKNITGAGSLYIDGAVTNSGNIANNIVINQNKSLETLAGKLGNTVENNGILTLTGGALGYGVTGTGVLFVNNSVSSNANYLGNNITNNGELTLTDGLLAKDVSGGSVIIDGAVTNTGSIDSALTINQNKSLQTAANLLHQNVANSGVLTLTGNTLSHDITGGGSVIVDGAVINNASIANSVNINSGKSLQTDADAIATGGTSTISNSGELVLTGENKTLSKNVTGNGTVVVNGSIINDSTIENSVSINSGKSLRTAANTIATGSGATISNAGQLILTSGALTKNITGTTGELVVDGAVTNSGDIANNVVINQDKSLETLAGKLGNTVENNGILTLNGGTLGHGVTGLGTVVVNNSVYANANYIGNNVVNNGELTLTGGALAKNVTGGNTVIDGTVTNTGTLGTSVIINQDKSLETAANLLESAVANSGQLILTGGTLGYGVTGTGTIVVNNSVSADAGYLGNNIANNGELTLTGGTLNRDVSGGGLLVVDGTVVNNASVINAVRINQNKSLETLAGLLGNTVENNGLLTLNGGTISHAITGIGSLVLNNSVQSNASYLGNDTTNNGVLTLTDGALAKNITGGGSLVVDGAVTNTGNIENNVRINQNKSLQTAANLLGNAVENNGVLTLTGNALSQDVTGTGLVVVAGNVTNSANIANSVEINSGKSLTSAINKIATGDGTTITNNGRLTFNGNGTLSKDISGTTGSFFVDGNIVNGANIENSVVVKSGKTLQTAADTIATYSHATITNGGNLTLTGGALTKNVLGNGTLNVNGTVTNSGSIENTVVVAVPGNLTTNADLLLNTVTNNGVLTLTGGALAYDLTGSGKLNILQGDELYVGMKNVTQDTIRLDGTMVALLDEGATEPRFNASMFNGFGTLRLTMRKAGTYHVFGDAMFDSRLIEFTEDGINVDSPVYNLVWDNNGNVMAAQKSAQEISDTNKLSDGAGLTVYNLMNTSSEKLQDLALIAQTRLAMHDTESVERAHLAMNPEHGAVVQSVGMSNQNMISNLVAGRTTAPIAKYTYGDLRRNAMWIQAVYNNSRYDGVFDSEASGIVAGIDGTIDKVLTFGAGYLFTHSDIDGTERDTGVNTMSVFLYGQYKPDVWYIDAFANYSVFDYLEKGVVFGDTKVSSDYDIKSFGGQIAAGYNFEYGLTPEISVRYMHLRGADYKNNLGIETEFGTRNYLTAMLGTKYTHDIELSKTSLLRPEFRYGLKYDVLSDDLVAKVSMPGVDMYEIKTESLSRIGSEFGASFGLIYQGLDLSLGYELEVRHDFISHTGRARIRYEF